MTGQRVINVTASTANQDLCGRTRGLFEGFSDGLVQREADFQEEFNALSVKTERGAVLAVVVGHC